MISRSVEEGNLGPGERRKRFVSGLIAFAVAVGLIAASWVNDLTGWVMLFFLTLGGSLGLLQAKGKT
jgi:hypothetical protein